MKRLDYRMDKIMVMPSKRRKTNRIDRIQYRAYMDLFPLYSSTTNDLIAEKLIEYQILLTVFVLALLS